MDKNFKGLAILVMTSLSLFSCGVSSDYDRGFKDGYAEGIKHTQQGTTENPTEEKTTERVTMYGDFTAIVCERIPDYIHPDEEKRGAIVRLYQSAPIIVVLDESICDEVKVGETYTFEVAESEIELPTYRISDDSDVLACSDINLGYRIDIKSCRTPTEDEYGMDSWRVKYKK